MEDLEMEIRGLDDYGLFQNDTSQLESQTSIWSDFISFHVYLTNRLTSQNTMENKIHQARK